MDFYAVQYCLYALCLVLCAAGFVFAVTRPPSQEQKLIMAIEFMAFIIMFGYWGCLQRRDASEDLLIFANKLEYAGACNVYVILLMMYMRYFRRRIPRPLYWAQIAFAVLMTIVSVSFDKHHLYYRSFHVENINGMNVLVKEYGPFHAVYVLMVLIYVIWFTVLWITTRKTAPKETHRDNNFLYFAVMIPSICYIIEKLLHLQSFKLTPVGLVITSLCGLYLITIRKFCDVNTVAQEMIFNSLDDAVIIIDRRMHLQQYNRLAGTLFPFLKKMSIGEHIDKLDISFEQIFSEAFNIPGSYPADVTIDSHLYQPFIKPIIDADGVEQGSILWLQDVTVVREKERMLQSNSERLAAMVETKTRRISFMQDKIIIGFSSLVENRNAVSGKHVRRTSSYVLIIAQAMKNKGRYPELITDEWVETLSKVAPLHDIGKIAIPDYILNKPGKLTPDEIDEMRLHTVHGADIIEFTLRDCVNELYFTMAKEVAHWHHERWDGTGYPDGIAGEKIPLSARIMAVADVFDALVTERPYKEAFTFDEAFNLIKSESGSHFDPEIVNIFIENRDIVGGIYVELLDDAEVETI